MKSNIFKRCAAFSIFAFMSVSVCFGVGAGNVSYAASSYQSQIDAAKEKQEKLKEKQKELEKKIAELNAEKANIEAYIGALDEQYAAAYEEYELTGEEIAETERRLVDVRAAYERVKAQEEAQYKEMMARVKYMYENGEQPLIGMLFGGADVTEIFNQLEYRQQITKYDNTLLENYKETKRQTAETEACLTAELETLKTLEEYQEANLKGLEQMSADKAAELEALAADLGVDEEMLYEYWDEIQANKDDIDRLVKLEKERIAEEERKRKEEEERLRREAELAASKSIKNIIWPLPGHSRITSYFGYRDAPTKDATTYHKGIDISANTGVDVLAAIAGKVVTATYSYSSGNYIVIDHGNGVRTIYCHASKLLVKVGDEVKRGQVIMKVGSTGVSTGSHLHFGIFINGTAVNPLDYVDSTKVLK